MNEQRGETSRLAEVHDFWNTEACGTHFISQREDRRDFFERFRKFRYETEWHLPLLVPFADALGKSILEIGCGNGADAVNFALNGARYTGVDLTEEAVESTTEHFNILGLAGEFRVENAEHLSFADNTFDVVYSHGVLHHTPHPMCAVDEVYRVLKPGGRAIIMLYHRNSFNYYIRIMFYMRMRLLLTILGKANPWKQAAKKQATPLLIAHWSNNTTDLWQIHYRNFLREGWSYLNAQSFVHHATDGPECPFAFVYSKTEARRLFKRFRSTEFRVAHFPLRKYSWGRLVPFWFERFLACRMGWYLFIYADK